MISKYLIALFNISKQEQIKSITIIFLIAISLFIAFLIFEIIKLSSIKKENRER